MNDDQGMEWLSAIKERYNITKEEEAEASKQTFAGAVSTLATADKKDRDMFLNDFDDLALSDGFCAKQEALLMIALYYALTDDYIDTSEVISIESPLIHIEDTQIIYIESRKDERYNEEIEKDYRQISKEIKVSGFSFVYIPYIIEHYKNTPFPLFQQIVSFLAPHLAEDIVADLIQHLTTMSTPEFCKDQLCNKLGMSSLRETNPSLLIKVGDTFANEKLFTNFLKIEIHDTVLQTVQKFLDRFMEMQSSDTIVIKNIEESAGQFLYHGFYKQLFDIYLLRSSIRSTVLVDPYKESITLPELHTPINGLHRREKALYTLFLIESAHGGVNFNYPESSNQINAYNKRMKQIQEKYNIIYEWFGGESGKAPNLEQPEIRRPMISCIKRCINKIDDILHHADDYTVIKNSFGHFCINLEEDLLFIIDSKTGEKTPLFHSEFYKKLMQG